MPIIESLLDTDFYKFTMGQIAYLRYPQVTVKYAFQNRTKRIGIGAIIEEEELRRELDHARTLRLSEAELHRLFRVEVAGKRVFQEEFIGFLRQLRLPPYYLERKGDTYGMEFPGRWCEAVYWETIALSIVNELYCKTTLRNCTPDERGGVHAEGRARLAEKIDTLKASPDVTFADFGSRRRFSGEWQRFVVLEMARELPAQFLGTSNTQIALENGLSPIGTLAHEMFMVLSGVMQGSDDEVRASHNRILRDWWEQYGWGLSVALTDTYGSDFFFRDMSAEQARLWKGLRHDSGDPIAFGEQAIAFYGRHGIDPEEKLLVFSDGLDPDAMVSIADHFRGRIKVSFGWGTNLTNDLGLDAISIVVKIDEANGNRTVKLSDNLAKATGRPEDIERFKLIFGYERTTYEEVRY